MPLELASISSALFDRIATDAAGAAVRALLGSAGSVITADKLGQRPLPARPLAVWRDGAVGGVALGMRNVTGTWWVYDDPGQGYARIHAVIAALETAYPSDVLANGRVRVGPVGQASDDRSLGGLLVRPLQIAYLRRA
jgi:hypothetical protein